MSERFELLVLPGVHVAALYQWKTPASEFLSVPIGFISEHKMKLAKSLVFLRRVCASKLYRAFWGNADDGDGNRLMFWHDVEAEFASVVEGLQLDGVQLVRLDDTPALRIKLDIERAPDQRWLIYSTQPEPEPTKDWLLDVRLRSKSFRADSTSILLEDLGLTTQALRHHLKERGQVPARQGPGGPPEAPGAAR
jgi:hypothetical protein